LLAPTIVAAQNSKTIVMHLHPALSAFPVPLLSVAFLFFLIGCFSKRIFAKSCLQCSPILSLLAAAGILAAYLSGLPAAESLALQGSVPDEIVAGHQSLGKLSLLSCLLLLPSATLLLLGKKSKTHLFFFGISLSLSLTLCTFTSWRGGSLVFEHAAGVQLPVIQNEEK
jgi:uncharacterized membrane protein